jgi:type I restriction enzyme S subunit
MSEGNQLPEGWAEATIEEIVADEAHALCIGPFGSNLTVADYRDDGVPLVFVRNIRSEVFRGNGQKYVSPAKAKELAAHRIKGGDLLVTKMGDPPGDCCLYPESEPEAIITADCVKIRLHSAMTVSQFVIYGIHDISFKSQIAQITKGVAQQKVSLARFRKLRLRLPPLPEQHRIVAKIEELFSNLDAGVDALERAKANLKRYRASILKSAVEGKLTEDWRREHPQQEDGQILLDRILRQRREKWEKDQLAKFKEKGKEPPRNWQSEYEEPAAPDTSDLPELPGGWAWATVEQVSVVVRGSSPRPAGDPRYFGGSVPWITVGPITADNEPYLKEVPEGLTEEGRANSRFIEPHTLLLTNSGATLGVPKITLLGGCINDGVAALLETDYPLKLYLLYSLRTQTTKLRRVNQGAAQPNLNTAIIKAIWVPLPPLAEQEQIVALVEERLSQIDSAEKTIDAERIRNPAATKNPPDTQPKRKASR